MKFTRVVLNWEFIIIAHLVFVTIILLSGCSVHTIAEVGESNFSFGTYFEKEATENE